MPDAALAIGGVFLPAAALLALAGVLAGVIVTLWRLVLQAKTDQIVDLRTRVGLLEGALKLLQEQMAGEYDRRLRDATEAIAKMLERMARCPYNSAPGGRPDA